MISFWKTKIFLLVIWLYKCTLILLKDGLQNVRVLLHLAIDSSASRRAVLNQRVLACHLMPQNFMQMTFTGAAIGVIFLPAVYVFGIEETGHSVLYFGISKKSTEWFGISLFRFDRLRRLLIHTFKTPILSLWTYLNLITLEPYEVLL